MDELSQIVVFKLKNELYGVSITQVKEIIKTVPVSKLPQAQVYIEGMANLRGRIHVIYNLRALFGFDKKETDEETRIIVISNRNVGFIVDEVHEIIHVEKENVDTLAELPGGLNKKFISGIVRNEDKLIIILNLEEILAAEK